MAHLWVPDTHGHLAEVALDAPGWDGPGVFLRPALVASGEAWVLLVDTAGSALVNGEPVPVGIRALDNRDEVRARDGTRVVFTDERLACVAAFPAGEIVARCARCTGDLEAGAPAVKCPACGSWYHEHQEFPCWTSAATCQACGQQTTVVDGERWTPEEC